MTRHDATEALRAAIIDHAIAHDITDDDEMLSDFAVIAHWQPIEADDRSRYTTQFSSPTVPSHVALGLFEQGAALIRFEETE